MSSDGYDFTSGGTTPATPAKQQNSSFIINMNHNDSDKLFSNSELKRRHTMDSDSFIVFESDTDKERSKTADEKIVKTNGSDSAVSSKFVHKIYVSPLPYSLRLLA